MIITKQQALDGIAAGNMRYEGKTEWDQFGKSHWIITDTAMQTTHHVEVWDSEPMIGCMSCGLIVNAVPDAHGCGCHCPACHATL